jgi:TP901 family phage tail tape measure protein
MSKFVIPSIFTAVDKLSGPVDKMTRSLRGFDEQAKTASARAERSFRKVGQAAGKIAVGAGAMATAVTAPLVVAINDAVKFEDKMADVAKTTGLEGAALDKFGKDILAMSANTRTSIESLQDIAAIGGQMGIANAELLKFTGSVNQFSVALGSDFQGGVEEATRSIAVLRNLFRETRGLDVSDAITKAGSAINAISAKGVSVPELTDFISRIGQLPDAVKPSIQATAALGAVLNKAGITSEIGARGLGDILMTAGQNLPAFAAQIKMTEAATKQLINSSPEQFLMKFASSLKGLKSEQLSVLLKSLKIGDVGAIKVVGALGTATENFAMFQSIANAEFAKGTSLQDEYNKKNETMAAKLAKAKNNFEALSITVGTQLLPILDKIVQKVAPMITSFATFVKEHPGIIKMVAALAGILWLITGIAGLVAGISAIGLAFSAIAGFLASLAPIASVVLLIFKVIGTLIMMAVSAVASFGALAIGIFLLLVSVVASFVRNWDKIVDAFKNGGIIAGIKMIGATLLDAVLWPLQKIIEMIAYVLPDKFGGDFMSGIAKDIEGFRARIGVDTGEQPELVNPQASNREAMAETWRATMGGGINVNVNDPNNRTDWKSNAPGINIKTTSTVGSF